MTTSSYRVAVIVAPDISAGLRRAAEHAAWTLRAAGHAVRELSPAGLSPAGLSPAGLPGALLSPAGLTAAGLSPDHPATEGIVLAAAAGGCEGLSVLRGSGVRGRPPEKWAIAGEVRTSLEEVGARAAEHLLAHHRRQLAVITNARDDERQRALVRGFVGAVRQARGADEESVLTEADGTERGARTAVERLLTHHRFVDGLFATDARSALAAIAALRRHGVSMPAGMAVVGYGTPAASERGIVALTTVDLASEQLGRVAARLVVGLIEGRRPGGWHVHVPPALVARRSAPTPPRLRHPALH